MSLTILDNGSSVHPTDPGEPGVGGGRTTCRVSVTVDEANILAGLAGGLTVLEIGTGLGVSTRGLARYAKSVTTVDPDPWVHEEIGPKLRYLGNVRLLSEIPEGEEFDLVFIDGNHAPKSVARDIEVTRPMCRRLMVFHDVNYSHVRDMVLQHFPSMSTIQTTHGIGVAEVST